MYLLIAGALVGGSSPRTRGTSAIFVRQYIGIRFIPAHAGNMLDLKTTKTKTTVHPRARGEHPNILDLVQGEVGSSPRTRGTCPHPSCSNTETRFIPAHAGNIRRSTYASINQTVHPRARGEHAGKLVHQHINIGSSPRTRGTSEYPRSRVRQDRFIPAHAGNMA